MSVFRAPPDQSSVSRHATHAPHEPDAPFQSHRRIEHHHEQHRRHVSRRGHVPRVDRNEHKHNGPQQRVARPRRCSTPAIVPTNSTVAAPAYDHTSSGVRAALPMTRAAPFSSMCTRVSLTEMPYGASRADSTYATLTSFSRIVRCARRSDSRRTRSGINLYIGNSPYTSECARTRARTR